MTASLPRLFLDFVLVSVGSQTVKEARVAVCREIENAVTSVAVRTRPVCRDGKVQVIHVNRDVRDVV